MSNQQELIQRWDSFLQKIETRFKESLAHAEEACQEQLVETDYEYETVFRSWSGMKAQIDELIAKIDTIWHSKVSPEMEAIGDFYLDEGHKASDTNDRLTEGLYAFQRQLEGKLSQQFYDHAIQIANKKASCSQCNADIEIRKDIFRSQYITCKFCNSVNTIEPETKFMKIGWGIIDNIAAIKTQNEYEAMNQASEAIRFYRGQAPDSFWITYQNAHERYWSSYFQERIKLSSDMSDRYEDDMGRKHKEFVEHKRIYTS